MGGVGYEDQRKLQAENQIAVMVWLFFSYICKKDVSSVQSNLLNALHSQYEPTGWQLALRPLSLPSSVSDRSNKLSIDQ